ncbi:MAG: outer membrane lipoprotein-sorting protein [Burkholderiaceae bacterium]|nr:outer membrane lipoprotein-sorting protein [Burkholderiaceae bacterium]
MRPRRAAHRLGRALRATALAACSALLPALLPALGTAHATEPEVADLLVAADRYRTGSDDLVVETLVSVHHPDGSLDRERRYTVYAQSGRRSLVRMRSPAEAGQKVLMLGDDFWLLLPGSQRPMRITPSQKLLGDASTGDIATLRWAEDYEGRRVGETRCDAPAAAGGSQACLHLSLQARRKGVSYQRIELWLGLPRHEPLRAELYLHSDRLAKQARFVTDRPERPQRIDAMILTDHLGGGKETRVRYLERRAWKVPEAWLNPMFLARNPTLE